MLHPMAQLGVFPQQAFVPTAIKLQRITGEQSRNTHARLGRIAATGSARVQTARRSLRCAAAVEEVAQKAPPVEQMDAPSASHTVRPAESDTGTQHESSASANMAEEGERGHMRPQSSSARRGRAWTQSRGGARGGSGGGGREIRGDRGFELAKADPRRAPCTEHNLKRLQVVTGRVIRSFGKGSLVELLDDPRIVGFVRTMDGPFVMRERVEGKYAQGMPVGLVRPFTVLGVPEDMEYYGRGPLLSAKVHDLDMLWGRARQMQAACEQDGEVFETVVTDVNAGGLLATLGALPGFIPFSLMVKDGAEPWRSPDEIRAQYVGKNVLVTVKDVSPDKRKVVLDMQQAARNAMLKSLSVGALVWGTVRRVENYGVFVGIDGTRLSGLLHISCISRSHIESVEDLFSEGDRIRAMLVAMDEGFSRISLSTADLEQQPGDMLYDKEKVYANAEESVKAAVQRIRQREQDEGYFHDNGGRDVSGGGSQDFDFDGDYRP